MNRQEEFITPLFRSKQPVSHLVEDCRSVFHERFNNTDGIREIIQGFVVFHFFAGNYPPILGFKCVQSKIAVHFAHLFSENALNFYLKFRGRKADLQPLGKVAAYFGRVFRHSEHDILQRGRISVNVCVAVSTAPAPTLTLHNFVNIIFSLKSTEIFFLGY